MVSRPPRLDEVWLVSLDPTRGSEIKKTRPCLVVSPDEMNQHLQDGDHRPNDDDHRPYPTRIGLTFQGKSGQVALDQIRAVDRERLMRGSGPYHPRPRELFPRLWSKCLAAKSSLRFVAHDELPLLLAPPARSDLRIALCHQPRKFFAPLDAAPDSLQSEESRRGQALPAPAPSRCGIDQRGTAFTSGPRIFMDQREGWTGDVFLRCSLQAFSDAFD